MLKKSLLTILAVLLLNLAAASPARAGAAQDADPARKAKERIARVGTGPEARVEVRLKGGPKLKGHVTEAADEGFTVVDASGKPTRVAYADVEKLKAAGAGRRRGGSGKDLIILAGIVGTIIGLTYGAAMSTK